jgi:hypothetical protein
MPLAAKRRNSITVNMYVLPFTCEERPAVVLNNILLNRRIGAKRILDWGLVNEKIRNQGCAMRFLEERIGGHSVLPTR